MFYRLPDTEEKQTELYERTPGSAQIHGQAFEYKFCALVFVRIKNIGYKFKLASNVEGLGEFDDVFVEYLDENSRKKHIFVQLKSTTRHRITMEQMLTKRGHVNLRKFYESYRQIKTKFNCSEEGVKLEGNIDDSLFILYTNADVEKKLKSNKVPYIGEEKFLMTGGSVLQFNEEEHKAIYEHLQDLPEHREFLSRFRIFYSQANEKEMDCHIKTDLKHIMKLRKSKLEIAYVYFRDFITEWWQNSRCFLQDTNSRENDPLRKTSEKLGTILVARNRIRKISNLKNSALNTNSPQ
jgi:hypothetical protein